MKPYACHPCCAPAVRAPQERVRRQAKALLDTPLVQQLYDAVSEIVVILNRERQIVFANSNCAEFLETDSADTLYGLRPGEALGCDHADDTPTGCGTTEFCKACGAVEAILAAQRGETTIKECRLTRKATGEALDLVVRCSPLHMGSERLTIFAVTDVSHEKRRRILERVFLHDIMNTAVGVNLCAAQLQQRVPGQIAETIGRICCGTNKLIEEINGQRDLMAAENYELAPNPESLGAMALLQGLVRFYRDHQLAKKRFLQIAQDAEDIAFVSDKTLLTRIIVNMLKNALEASQPGDAVTLGCDRRRDRIEFWVHNPNFMPREVQLQVFKRSFSTKGMGRGLGTYSIKLLSERCLQGKVGFKSTETEGTTFMGRYPLTLDGS